MKVNEKSTRYDTSALPEAQFEPGSCGRVLRNRLGIKRKKEMDEAETVALAAAIRHGLNRDYKLMEKIFSKIIGRALKAKANEGS